MNKHKESFKEIVERRKTYRILWKAIDRELQGKITNKVVLK